ncbi:MAG: RNHCP domain-containing protein [Planctomycetota bacterium]
MKPSRSGRRRDGFQCIHCRQFISNHASGTQHRNHCPWCLWSRHLDDKPGDRASPCRAPTEPIAITVRPDGEWAIVHRCTRCRDLKTNRIAGDDSELALLQLALRPLALPAFPLDALGALRGVDAIGPEGGEP